MPKLLPLRVVCRVVPIHATLLLLLALAAPVLVGCGASGRLTAIRIEPSVSIKNVGIIPDTPPNSRSSDWAGQDMSYTLPSVQLLPDSRLLFAYIDEADADETPVILKLYSAALDEVWSVRKILGPTIGLVGVSAGSDRASLLAVKYDEDADEDSVRLVRLRFSFSDGSFISCDTIARTRGALEVNSTADSGFKAYRLLRSPDSSKILAYQTGYQYEHSVTRGSLHVLVLDQSFEVLYSRMIDFPVSSFELEPDPDDWEGPIEPAGLAVDNEGGVYVAALEEGRRIRVSYYTDRESAARTGAYKLDVAPFRRIYENDADVMTLSDFHLSVVKDRLLVTTRVIEEEEPLGQVYGLASVEFPRTTMESRARVLHAFDEDFAERLADDDEAEGMSLTAAIPLADGSLVALFDHLESRSHMYVDRNAIGRQANVVKETLINRFGVAHYDSSGTPKWSGSVDDDYYELSVGGSASPRIFAPREVVRDGNSIDIVHRFGEKRELRTISFDVARDSIIVGRSIAKFESGQFIPRNNLLWSTPSRLLVLLSSGGGDEYVLNLIESTDGRPLFFPRYLGR